MLSQSKPVSFKYWFLVSYLSAAIFTYPTFFMYAILVDTSDSKIDGFLAIYLALIWVVLSFEFFQSGFQGDTLVSDSEAELRFYLILTIAPIIVFYLVRSMILEKKILGQQPSLGLLVTISITFFTFAFDL
jgi:hypothetical protein